MSRGSERNDHDRILLRSGRGRCAFPHRSEPTAGRARGPAVPGVGSGFPEGGAPRRAAPAGHPGSYAIRVTGSGARGAGCSISMRSTNLPKTSSRPRTTGPRAGIALGFGLSESRERSRITAPLRSAVSGMTPNGKMPEPALEPISRRAYQIPVPAFHAGSAWLVSEPASSGRGPVRRRGRRRLIRPSAAPEGRAGAQFREGRRGWPDAAARSDGEPLPRRSRRLPSSAPCRRAGRLAGSRN